MRDAVCKWGVIWAAVVASACSDPPVRPLSAVDSPIVQPSSMATPSESLLHHTISDRPVAGATPDDLPTIELKPAEKVATVQAEAPRYSPPESLQKFRYAKPPKASVAPKATVADAPPVKPVPPVLVNTAPTSPPPIELPVQVDLPATRVATVKAEGDSPRYALPESLQHWRSGRKVPLYIDPDAAPWQSSANEPRLMNAAVSCNYKDEGGVRGKALLLVDQNRLTRFAARIEMPNGGVCEFDSRKMTQISFEQGIALQAKNDECVVRMWEQKNRITVAAYSCHKQCSKGSFSYLWPIIMDTRVGTCY